MVYQSGSQVTCSGPSTWNHVSVESLAQWAYDNALQSGLGTVRSGSRTYQSCAGLGQGAVVAELLLSSSSTFQGSYFDSSENGI